jgi:hypothetical protein
MDIGGLVRSFRKLGHYIVAAFPRLERLEGHLRRWVGFILTLPIVAPIVRRLSASPRLRSVFSVVQFFWWRKYSAERVSVTPHSPEALAILRPVMILAALLCILAPVAAAWPFMGIPAEEITGAAGPVSAWSILLWLLTLAVAFGALLVGAAVSNRPSFLVVCLMFLYFGAFLTSAGGPPSVFNVLFPLAVMGVTAFAERMLCRPGGKGLRLGLETCLLLGLGAGIAFRGLTPVRDPYYIVALLTGTALGTVAILWGRAGLREPPSGHPLLRTPAPQRVFLAVIAAMFLLFLTLTVRGGWGATGSAAVSFLDAFTGQLWPVWYMLGAGVVFKVLLQSRVISDSLREVMPRIVLGPLLLLTLLAVTILLWSGYVLDTPGLPWPGFLTRLMETVYQLSAGWFWSEPTFALAAGFMRWLAVLHLAAAAWLTIRGRLTTGIAFQFVFQMLLLWLGTTQYFVNFTSLGRDSVTSPIAILALSLMLLWLLYRVGLPRTFDSSPRWPSVGRVAIFGGLVLFILLDIHSRAAIHDRQALQRAFYYMFRGLVDFGLPFFLLLYATRAVTTDAPSLARVMLFYAFGAGAALLLNAADKIVTAGGSFPALFQDLDARFAATISGDQGEMAALAQHRPFLWIVFRAALVAGFLLLVARIGTRRLSAGAKRTTAVFFLVVAAAAGVASFSQIRLDLPVLSARYEQLFTPDSWSLELDVNLLAIHLTYVIPALLLALLLTRPSAGRTARRATAFAAAFGALLLFLLLWPGEEAWLRSTGLIFSLGFVSIWGAFLLIRAARTRLSASGLVPVLEDRAAFVLALAFVVPLLILAVRQYSGGRVRMVEGANLTEPIPLSMAWTRDPSSGSRAPVTFTRTGPAGIPSRLTLRSISREAASTGDILVERLRLAAAGRVGFEPIGNVRRLDRHLPGALATDYFFTRTLPDGRPLIQLATIAVLPRPEGQFLLVEFESPMRDHAGMVWSIPLLAERLQDRRLDRAK